MIKLSDLFNEINDIIRNSATGTLGNSKRTRAVNWVLRDLQNLADWKPLRTEVDFEYIGGVHEYSIKDYIGATTLDKDGSTTVSDFKNPYQLRLNDEGHDIFNYFQAKDVRRHINNDKYINEYAIDGDTLIVNYPQSTAKRVHNCDSLTANGTWEAKDDGSNLTLDEVVYKQGDGCLNLDVSAGTQISVENDDFTAQDLEGFKNNSYWLVWVYLPTISDFSNITLQWGSSSANYWEKAEQTPLKGDLQTGWNLFAFKWEDSTETGTPDVENIDYLKLSINYSSSTTDTDFRIDDIRVSKTETMTLTYFAESMVYDSDDNKKTTFNDTNVSLDEYLVDDDFSNVIVEGASYRLNKIQGGQRESDMTDAKDNYFTLRQQLMNEKGVKTRRPIRKLKFMR